MQKTLVKPHPKFPFTPPTKAGTGSRRFLGKCTISDLAGPRQRKRSQNGSGSGMTCTLGKHPSPLLICLGLFHGCKPSHDHKSSDTGQSCFQMAFRRRVLSTKSTTKSTLRSKSGLAPHSANRLQWSCGNTAMGNPRSYSKPLTYVCWLATLLHSLRQ